MRTHNPCFGRHHGPGPEPKGFAVPESPALSFVRFPKALLEAVIASRMAATQMQIVLTVIRRTYGYGNLAAPISRSLLVAASGRSERGVRNALDDLVREGVLVVVAQHQGSRPTILAVNPDVRCWGQYSSCGKPFASQVEEQLQGYPPTRLAGCPHTPTIEKKKESHGDADACRGSHAYRGTQIEDMVRTALEGRGLDPRLPAAIRDAIRRGDVTTVQDVARAANEGGGACG